MRAIGKLVECLQRLLCFTCGKRYQNKFEVYLSSIVENAPAYIFWKDKNLVYLGCNQRFAELVNQASPESVIGKTDFDLDWGEGEAEFYRETDRRVLAGVPWNNAEEELVMPNGDKIMMLVSKARILDSSDECLGVLGMSFDITERKRAEELLRFAKEEAEKSNKAKTEFIQNMQHDIRTPASGLSLMLKEMFDQETDPEKKEMLELLSGSAIQLLGLCNDLVEFNHFDQTEQLSNQKQFEIRETLLNVIELNRPIAFRKGLNLQLTIAGDIPLTVIADEFRIRRVLINLISNAIKFTEEGTVKLNAYLKQINDIQAIVCLEILDTGMGMERDKIPVIFDKFSRLFPSSAGRYKGFGLGLYLVKKFVDDLGGQIKVDSEPGQGSTFAVTLPLKLPLGEPAIGHTEINQVFKPEISAVSKEVNIEQSPKSETPATGHCVLLIEDDKLCLLGMKHMLSRLTQNMDIAMSVAQAKDKLASAKYDFVLSDIGLSDGDGFEIIRWARTANESANLETPFFAVTAGIDPEQKKVALKSGFRGISSKPLNEEKLKAIFEDAIGKTH